MINRYLNLVFGAVIQHFLKEKIRRGSIQAVKGYIQGVRVVRLGLMGLFAAGAVSALLIAGVVLMIVGIVGLLPVEAMTSSIILIVIGALLSGGVFGALLIAFSQKRWLAMSKSYELMEAVTAPWPGNLPPNPFDVMAGRTKPQKQTPPEEPASYETFTGRDEFAHDAQLATPLV